MKIILKALRMGKTSEAIKLAAENFSYIVCHNRQETDRIFRVAQNLEVDIPHPITFDDLLCKRYYGAGVKGFIIDNADHLLQQLCNGVELKGITMTQ